MNKNALLINPPTPDKRKFTRNIGCAAESKGDYLLKPVDLTIISGILAPKYNVSFLDFVSNPHNFKDALAKVKESKADFIIMTLIDVIFVNDFSFLKLLREELPTTAIFVLGDAFIEKSNREKVEPIVQGIITEPFKLKAEYFNLIEFNDIPGFHHKTSFQLNNKTPETFHIPTPKHELFDDIYYKWPFSRNSRYATLTTVWGCPYACRYCTAARFPVHTRENNELIKELLHIESLGFKELYITDYSFGANKKQTIDLLKLWKKESFSFSWSVYFHPNQFDKELLLLMKDNGCHTIICGVESQDTKTLKKYGRSQSNNKIKELIAFSHSIGIEVCGDFLIGLKEQTKDDILSNIKFSKWLNLDFASFNLVAPLPGTTIREQAREKGLLLENSSMNYDSLGSDGILQLGQITERDLKKLRDQSVKRFYIRPSFLIRKFFKIKSLNHFWILIKNFYQLMKKSIFS